MQGNYDDQIGGAFVGEPLGVGGGPAGNGGGPAQVAFSSGGMAGGLGMRIEGDTKDVSASHNAGGAHNQQFIGQPQHAQPPIHELVSYRDQDLTKCKIHRVEEIKAFCKNCLCSICFKCLLGDHRNHDVVMLDELQPHDLKDKVGQFHDKIDSQVTQLASMREKVHSIKENYDKKFEELFMQFKNIESLFLQGYFEQETLGDIKNCKQK